MPKLPPRNRDLSRYVIKNDLRRICFYAAWLAIFLLGAMAYNQNHQTYPPEKRMEGWRLLVWMAIAAVTGFFLFRIWRFLTDRPRCGTVLQAGLSHTYTPGEEPGMLRQMDYDFRLKNALLLKCPNGKKARLRFEQKTGSYLYYQEGAELIRFRGLPYPINTDPRAPHGYVCVACGRIHTEWNEHCAACGLSLIDPKEILDDTKKG